MVITPKEFNNLFNTNIQPSGVFQKIQEAREDYKEK